MSFYGFIEQQRQTDYRMEASSSQTGKQHTSLKQRARSLDYRLFKSRLQTGCRFLRIREGDYAAVFDRSFCDEAQGRNLIKRIDNLMSAGQILKDDDICDVSRIEWNGRDVVVKRYNHIGLIHSFRYTIKKSRAWRAWLNAHYLEALQILTPRSVAYIEQRKGLLVWQSYLVTEYVEGPKLRDFLRDESISEHRRLDEIGKIADLLNRLWNNRITHGDTKHTNVLITKSGPILTDLDGMMVHWLEPLYRSKKKKDVRRFLRKTDVPPQLYDRCRALIVDSSDVSTEPMNDFKQMRIGNWTIRVRKDFPENNERNLLSLIDSPAPNVEHLVPVPSSQCARVFRWLVTSGPESRAFYVKRYLCRSALDFIKHLCRPSRARRAFEASLMLQRNGFDAPVIVGLFERYTGPVCTDNLLLTEAVDSVGSLSQILTEISRDSGKNAAIHKRELIRAFGETTGRMHARNIFHGDLRIGNVLVVEDRKNRRFSLLDNERTKKFYLLPARLRLKNLVQINMFRNGITNTDRMRFFKAYLDANPIIQTHYKKWAGKIIAKTLRRLKGKDRLKG